RRHLDVHHAPDPALEKGAGDRTHGAFRVDLDPHHGLGPRVVLRLELHPPTRRGRAHRPGERHAVWRIDRGHVLRPVVRGPERTLRAPLHARARLKATTPRHP